MAPVSCGWPGGRSRRFPALLGRTELAARLHPVSRSPGRPTPGRDPSRTLWPRSTAAASARIVDKMPDNYMYIGLLVDHVSRGVFIHCRRDLRDIAVSCWMTDFRSIRWANDQSHIAARFQQYDRVMNHWKEVLPVPVHDVKYEDTVTDLESVARRLIDACGLPWEPACLEFHRTERPVRTASVMQVRQPVYQRSVARWKHYETELEELFGSCPVRKSRGNNSASQVFGSKPRVPGLSPSRG